MSEGKVIRLVNAAKEFNVGFHSIVEHLKSKGFVIEDKPTTKLTEDMYNVLSKEFQSSMAIKEKADLIAIGRTRKEAEVEEGELEIGQVSALIKSIRPAGELVKEIWNDFRNTVNHLKDL